MFTGPVGPVEDFFYWPEAVLGNFYWPWPIGSPLASSPGVLIHFPAKVGYDNATLSLIFALMLIVLYIAIFPSVGE